MIKKEVYDTLHGTTEMSKNFIKKHLNELKNIEKVVCKDIPIAYALLYERKQIELEYYDSCVKNDYRTYHNYLGTTIYTKSGIFETTGFSWGYCGEGCSGLKWMLIQLGFLEKAHITEEQLMSIISSAPQEGGIVFNFVDGSFAYL